MVRIKVKIPPGGLIDPAELRRATQQGLDQAAVEVQKRFEATTRTWQNQPDFAIEQDENSRTIGTDDEIYGYVSEGTRPHVIVAKAGGSLAFGPGSTPKTQPRVIGSGPGGRGGAVIFRPRVNHPGTEARDFESAIAEEAEEFFPALMQQAIDEVLE